MSLLCRYFVASSDRDAASSVDLAGGPGQAAAPSPPGRGLFRRRDIAATAEAAPTYTILDGGGIEPTVQMGTLEELLTGRSYEDIVQAETGDEVVAMRGEGATWVAKLTDPLTAALAESSSDTLASVAEAWSQTEEFWGSADPQMLLSFLEQLSDLARQSREQQGGLYCWVSR